MLINRIFVKYLFLIIGILVLSVFLIEKIKKYIDEWYAQHMNYTYSF